ncbi:radical SAM protein [Thermosediminibacter oceani]|uniref:Radical SAM domain protein n=1 Tax=Thermosediminibacter oceani (strain ATCC BAA-1034 / DSM 16646 / JW/IW-1228P) TaxID=555079 RepID=D9S0F0_THEOJ|nr:radical SAM protein [Thermosediminibacter oceani]ADL08808.1 Radical SAM domain protein [Thermosediminibacter oceani DSM 16646]
MEAARAYLGEKVLEQGIKFLMKEPINNMEKLIEWVEKIPMPEHHRKNVASVKKFLQNKDTNWYRLAERLLTKTHPSVRQKMAINFFVNASFLGVPKQIENAKKLGCSVPWALLVDPTERCNLNCIGCWAGDYQKKEELSFELLDRICTEAQELGIYFMAMSGGEPLLRKNDIVKLAEKHSSMVFHLFTNGTLVDDALIEDMKRLGNITLAFSIEGFEEATDRRRGRGVFKKVMEAMEKMKEAGLVYGASVTYTRHNTEELASPEFVDMLVEKGAAFAWYFTYIPIGKDVDLDMMATPEQRAYIYDKILEYRKTKPILIVDFWNDGEASNGCIAGGRRYLHINAQGEVEPCAFVHYSTCNIKNVSLKEALCSPLMKAYQKRQPFNMNMRRPCPLIDNPDMLREIVEESGAYSTQLTANETASEFAEKLKPYAEKWGEIADKIWYDNKRVDEVACREGTN